MTPPASPPAGEAVGRVLPTAGPVMDDNGVVSDSSGIAEFGSTDTGALDAGEAVKEAGVSETWTGNEVIAVDIESEVVGIRLETAGVGLGTVDIGLGIVGIGLGTVDVGLGLVGVALVEGAADTTGACKGTSTEAWAAGGCSKAAGAGAEDGRASGSTSAEEEIRTVLSVPVDNVPTTASVGAVVPTAGDCTAWSAEEAGAEEGAGGDGDGGGGGGGGCDDGGGGGLEDAWAVLVCICGAS